MSYFFYYICIDMAKRFFRNNNPNDFKDLGFGTQVNNQVQRMLNTDGSFNVIRKGVKGQGVMNLYNLLITMSWRRFIVIIVTYFFLANLLFASFYVLGTNENLGGETGTSGMNRFWDAFFFSAQTLSTVGYGHIHPITVFGNIIAAVESLTGLLGFALATGLLYGRFSRPNAKIIYSDNAIISPYKETTAFMFRLANLRSNQLIETTAILNFSMVVERDGKSTRIFERLKLERDKIDFFPTTWTIVHPIDENSPMYGLTEEEVNNGNAEFILLINAFDDTFSQTVHSRRSYKHHEIIWGAKFPTMIDTPENGKTVLRLDKISETVKVELPVIVFEE